MTRKRLSGWGRAGVAMLAIHVALFFFPPIPPDIKGSLWNYSLGYGSVLMLLIELGRQRDQVVDLWWRMRVGSRWTVGLGLVAGALVFGVGLWTAAPSLFARFSAEHGLWEPLTLFCYLGSALILARGTGSMDPRSRKHWRFVAALYLLMGLEEIDYFGIFGGFIGYVDGVYSGSLHDLIRLAAEGVLSPAVWVSIGVGFIVFLATLYRLGYLQPRAIAAMVGSLDFVWVILGFAFVVVAGLGEANVWGMELGEPTFEELLEFAGAVTFACYALQLAGPNRLVTQSANDGLEPVERFE